MNRTKQGPIHLIGPGGTNAHQVACDYALAAWGTHNLVLDYARGNYAALEAASYDPRDDAIGVVPIENYGEGLVRDTVRFWGEELHRVAEGQAQRLHVVGEWHLPIRYVLARRKEGSAVQIVLSHPQALGQCSRRLASFTTEPALSTAAAAAAVSRGHGGRYAVCSPFTAEIYDLKVVERDIQDDPHNETRFHVVRRGPIFGEPTGRDRTSLLFEVRDEPGAIHEALGCFARRSINASFPLQVSLGPRRYAVYVEVECHQADDRGGPAIASLSQLAVDGRLLVLGSYPQTPRAEEAP